MDFELSDEQVAARELTQRILGEHVTHERLSALDVAGDWFDRDVWRQLADAGLLGLALPEDVGGGGFSFLELHDLLVEVGATAAYLPVWETLVLGALPVARFGTPEQRQQLLPRVADGASLLTAALIDDGSTDPREPLTTARRSGDGWVLSGLKTLVPIAELADRILVPARTDEPGAEVLIVLVDPAAPGVELRHQDVMGRTPHSEVVLAGVAVHNDDVLGDPSDGAATLEWILERAVAGLAAMQAGACTAALRLAATYTSQRQQFGRPIASFQAVGQRLADAFIDTEAVRLTALQAAWRLAAGLPAADEITIAKWWSAEAGQRVIRATQHVHGGMGVDRSYPLHRYFLLSKRIEFTLGTAATHLAALGASLAAQPV